MKTKRFLVLVVGVIVTFGAVQADAADRFFQIHVKLIAGGLSAFFDPPGPPGPNCYSFLEDGTWNDPLFPVLGMWAPAEPRGVVERYSAIAEWEGSPPDEIPPLTLVQEGQITPAGRNGQARLQAFSTVFLGETDIVLAEFMSTGREVDECP